MGKFSGFISALRDKRPNYKASPDIIHKFERYFLHHNGNVRDYTVFLGEKFGRKIMTHRDEGKASLVEFLRSIKFVRENKLHRRVTPECPTHFAHFNQRARSGSDSCVEDSQLIRSAN